MIKDMKILVNGQEIEFPFDLKNFFSRGMPRGFCFPQEQDFGQLRDIQRPIRPMRMVRREKRPETRQVKTVWYNVDVRKDIEVLNERVERLEELLIKEELKKSEKVKPKTKGISKTKEKLKKVVKDSKTKKK